MLYMRITLSIITQIQIIIKYNIHKMKYFFVYVYCINEHLCNFCVIMNAVDRKESPVGAGKRSLKRFWLN